MKINHDFKRNSTFGKTVRKLLSERSILGYFRNRFEWHVLPRVFYLKNYPIHLDIEPTSHCQLHCPMCFREHRKIENEGIMPLDLYKRIIDEIEGKVYSIKFTGRGEPLINKKFNLFLEYLKDKDFKEVALITNGQLLTEKLMNCMIDTGMDRIAFSIDGLKKEYEEIRAPIKYEEIYEIVKKLHELKKQRGSTKPLIRIQAVDSCVTDKEEFLKKWEPVSDEVNFLVFKDYSADKHSSKQAAYACPFLYQRLMVHWNGTVPMCVNDEYEEGVVGEVRSNPVHYVWHGKRMKGARKAHKMGLRDEAYKNCAKCALHREHHGFDNILYKVSTLVDKVRTEKQ